MNDILPEAVRQGLEQARKAALHRNDRLSVHDGEDVFRILRFWDSGMSVAAKHAGKLRGRVEIYDGARHLYQCLLENGHAEGDEMVFDFKWLNPVTASAPVDFELPEFTPAALIAKA